MTRNRCIFFTMLAGVLLLSPAVRAQGWSAVASACEPGSDSIGRYVFNEASFEFADGVTGTIRTRCQVNNPLDKGLPGWWVLSAGLITGQSGGAYVKATLNRVSKGDGSIQTIATLYQDNAPNPFNYSTYFTHTFDFTNFAYYVTLEVGRAVDDELPRVYCASLN